MGKKHAVRLIVSLLVCVMVFSAPAQAAVVEFDHFYPSYDELIDFLDNIDSPIVASEVIGSSDEASPRDIKAYRISDNPAIDEDEPAFLFIGVIHGDEPIGVRVVLQLIETLTENYGADEEVTDWVNAYEIWVVPVLNPYGYDNNQRKNGPQMGGVDLNRNFDFRWDEAVVEPPNDDTYKGPSAASEPETQAIGDFVLEQRPAFGITFHSGRGGSVGEIMWPWSSTSSDYPLNVDPPDRGRIEAIADVIAEAVKASRGGIDKPGTVAAAPIGQSNVYHYAVTGMFDYMLETNADIDGDGNRDDWNESFFYNVDMGAYTPDMETRLALAQGYVSDYLDGIKGLLRYFLFDTTDGFTFSGPGMTGLVHDCFTGEPLPATVKVLELDDLDGDGDVDVDDLDVDSPPDGVSDVAFRTADPMFGRYMRLLEPGTWTVEFSLVFGAK